MAQAGAPAVPAAGSRDASIPRPETPERAYWTVLADGAMSRTMEVLTGGAVLAALALALGASGIVVGLLLAIVPAAAQLTQLAAVHWVRRSGNVKAVCLGLVVPARLILLAAAALPFVARDLGAIALVPLVLASGVLANWSGVAWSVWMNELLPRERLGRFYAARLGIMSAAGVATLVLSAWFLSGSPGSVERAALLFGAGAVAGLVGALFIAGIPARTHVPAPRSSMSPVVALRNSPEYRRALPGFVGLSAGAHLFMPFGAAVLLLSGTYSEAQALALVAWIQVVNLVSFPLLGKYSDARGHGRVAGTGAVLLAVVALGWAASAAIGFPLWAIVPVYSLIGVATAATDLAVGNLQMTLAPRGEAPALFAGTAILRAVVNALAGAVAGLMLPAMAGGDPWVWVAGAVVCAASAIPLARAVHRPVALPPPRSAREAAPGAAAEGAPAAGG